MSSSNLKPYADLKVKVREYTDKDGNTKGVWREIGTLFSSPHQSNMFISIDTLPLVDFSKGLTVAVFKREDFDTTNNETKDDGEVLI